MKGHVLERPTYKRDTLLLEDVNSFKEDPARKKGAVLIREDCEDPYWLIPHAIATRNQPLFETALSASTLPKMAVRHWRTAMYAPEMESKDSEDCLAVLPETPDMFVCEFSDGTSTTFYANPMERWQEAERLLYHMNAYKKTSLTIRTIRLKSSPIRYSYFIDGRGHI